MPRREIGFHTWMADATAWIGDDPETLEELDDIDVEPPEPPHVIDVTNFGGEDLG